MNFVADAPDGFVDRRDVGEPAVVAVNTIVKIFVCPEHIYTGHFNQPPGRAPMIEVLEARAVAGRGLDGDRYSDRPEGHKGQVTFFAEETWKRLGGELRRSDRGLGVFRRNVILRGIDLITLIGVEFDVQGVRFRGVEHCKPCVWMDTAFGPGTLNLLSIWQAGGLRAAVLSDGRLRAGSQ